MDHRSGNRSAAFVLAKQLFQPAFAFEIDKRHCCHEASDLVRREIRPHAAAAFIPTTQYYFIRPAVMSPSSKR